MELAFGIRLHRWMKVSWCLNKHFSCHLQHEVNQTPEKLTKDGDQHKQVNVSWPISPILCTDCIARLWQRILITIMGYPGEHPHCHEKRWRKVFLSNRKSAACQPLLPPTPSNLLTVSQQWANAFCAGHLQILYCCKGLFFTSFHEFQDVENLSFNSLHNLPCS